jgi:hypothetical protein
MTFEITLLTGSTFRREQLFAFDIVGELTFSNSFGFMEAGSDDGSFNQIETALKSAAWM